MDRSSRNNKLQNALFELETKENKLVYKRPICSLDTLIRIILSDEPFEKTMHDIFYGIRCLFPFFLSPACSKIYNISILEKALRRNDDVKVAKLVDPRNQIPKKFYLFKKNVTFSYKIEDIIGPNQCLNEFTKVSKDKFLNMLHHEAKRRSYSSKILGSNCNVKPLLQLKHKYSSFNNKEIEAPHFISIIEKVQNNKLSRIPKKAQLLPFGKYSRTLKKSSFSSKKLKKSVNDSFDNSEKKLNKDGVPNSKLDHSVSHDVKSRKKSTSNLEEIFQAVIGTEALTSSIDLKDNVGDDETNQKTASFSCKMHRPRDFENLQLNPVDERNDINQAISCNPNLPCSVTVAGYKISIGLQANNQKSIEKDTSRISAHRPLRVGTEKIENPDGRFLIARDVNVSNITKERLNAIGGPDQLLPMRDAASSVCSCPLYPIQRSFRSPPLINLTGIGWKERKQDAHPSLLNTITSDLEDTAIKSCRLHSVGVSPKTDGNLDASKPKDVQLESEGQSGETSAINSNMRPSNEESSIESNLSLDQSYSLPFTETDVCNLIGEFNSIPNEVVTNSDRSPNIWAIGLKVLETPIVDETCNVLSQKKSAKEKITLTERSIKLKKGEIDTLKNNKKIKRKKNKKIENNDGKEKALPEMAASNASNLLSPVTKSLDMPTLFEDSVDNCNAHLVGRPVENLLNIPMKLNFVKGRDLKCVRPETFQQCETYDSSFLKQFEKDDSLQIVKNNLGLELPVEQVAASVKGIILTTRDKNVSSKTADKLITRVNTNNQSLVAIRPDVSMTAVASGHPVMISKDSSADIQQLLDQLNNDKSDLSERLSVICSEYLPAKKSVLGGSCGSDTSKNDPCPFKENCPSHKRKSVELCTPNKKINRQGLTNQTQKTEEPQFEKLDSSLSLIVKDLSKDVIDFHVKKIKALFKWLRYDGTYRTFSCHDCCYEVGDSSYEMGFVKVIHSVGDFRLNHFYDLCIEHSTSHFHCISVILKKYPIKFRAIKFMLMNFLPYFLSLDELVEEILVIFKEYAKPEWKAALINLIELVRSLNERQILFVVRQLNLPVSFVLDFCKGIAIMRFVLLTGEPIEYSLVIGKLSVKSVKCFLGTINIREENVIFFKVVDKCGCCNNCDFTSVKEVGLPLPVRFPSVKELLLLIQKDTRLGTLFKFSKGIFLLYEEFPQKFKEIEGAHVLKKFQTCFWPALEFVLKEQEKLKELCLDIFASKGNIVALGLAKYPLHFDSDIAVLLDKIKTTCIEIRNFTKRCEVETSFIDQLPSSFQSLYNNVSKSFEVNESVRHDLSNFVLENSRNECCRGRQHVSDFEFLTYPSTLMALDGCPKSFNTFNNIYMLAKPFVKEESRKVLEDLQLFGKFLFDNFDAYCIPLIDILKVFHTHEFVRQNFPLSHCFYYVVGTLPFFPAYVERSLYYVGNVCQNFTEKFGKGVGFNLAMIYFQQQYLPLVKSNLTAYCVHSFIENAKASEKIKS